MIPVHAIVRQFGFSLVPQDTSAGGTGTISVAPGQCTFFIVSPLTDILIKLSYQITAKSTIAINKRKHYINIILSSSIPITPGSDRTVAAATVR